ncbi:MAG: DUF3578 domain-containing protein [Desulfobacteraceae bacterium]|nr:MAG: DUF3578 domain-containing protein [Desulfobacteraceae bacterium]
MNDTLKDIFISIMEKYPSARSNSPYPGDGTMKNSIEISATNAIQSFISGKWNHINWKIEGSVGKGQWATIPWIAILNTAITKTVSQDVYIVFLFSAKGNKVFVTLNQGTGGINRAQSGQVQSELREEYLSKILEKNLTFNKGALPNNSLEGDGNTRAKAYEEACILWKEYKLAVLKGMKDDSAFLNDIEELVQYYTIAEKLSKIDASPQRKNSEKFKVTKLQTNIESAGFKYDKKLILRFISALCTKPFVILTGLSGSGKTKLAQVFSQWIIENQSQYCLIPVGSDWTNRDPLIGYPNALIPGNYIKSDNGILDLIIEASKHENSNKPFFLILDEMNLSHVERYFSDFLSTMESGGAITLHDGSHIWKDSVPAFLSLPKNLFIIGTVNIDETTYMFSPKVLDRASVIEFSVSEDEMRDFLNNPVKPDLESLAGAGVSMADDFVRISNENIAEFEDMDNINNALLKFFNELKKTGSEFGYRTASEIYRFAGVIKKLIQSDSNEDPWATDEVIDAAVMQKLLPKVHGSRKKLEPVLNTLAGLCLLESSVNTLEIIKNFEKAPEKINDSDHVRFKISLEKILRMKKRAIQEGFTSFAEA